MALKVFISWGGPKGQVLAEAIQGFLRNLSGEIDAFVSSSRVESGADWRARILSNVLEADIGVCAITPDFWQRPWPIWESGGLFFLREQRLGSTDPRLLPVLWGVEPDELRATPFEAFQCRSAVSEEQMKLLASDVCRLLETPPSASDFDRLGQFAWQEFDRRLADAKVPTHSHRSPSYLTELVEDIWIHQQTDALRRAARPVLDKAQADLARIGQALDEPIETDLSTISSDASDPQYEMKARRMAALRNRLREMNGIIGSLQGVVNTAGALGKRTSDMRSRRGPHK